MLTVFCALGISYACFARLYVKPDAALANSDKISSAILKGSKRSDILDANGDAGTVFGIPHCNFEHQSARVNA